MSLGRCLQSVALRYRQPACWLERVARPALPGYQAAEAVPPADEVGGGARHARAARLEAISFLAREPLGSRKLAQLTGLADGTKARTLVRALNRRYDAEGSAFRVEEIAGGFQLLTRARFAPWLRRLNSAPREVRLSAPALETLAVVAYRQPVLRAEIEAVRGVQCGEVLRSLSSASLCGLRAGPRNWAARCCTVRRGSFCRFSGCGTWRIYLAPSFCRLRSLSPRSRTKWSPILPHRIWTHSNFLTRTRRRLT